MQRPFLKWAGGKFALLPRILPLLQPARRFFEPFLGAGAVFLNTEHDEYHLNDINPDLIDLYQTVKDQGEDYIKHASSYFKASNNDKRKYYQLRETFNHSKDIFERSCLFLYLNRHGYNGLCRYNSQGQYNVPFGSYEKVYFPDEAIYYFHQKSQKAKFYCMDFNRFLKKPNRAGDVVYADPPYYPLSASANFTHYSFSAFDMADQKSLASCAEKLAKKQVKVVLSNHAIPETLALYHQAKLDVFPVKRYISCIGDNRQDVQELLAVYTAHN